MCADDVDLGHVCRSCGKPLLSCWDDGPAVSWHAYAADAVACTERQRIRGIEEEQMNEFFKCRKPDCFRKVKPGISYCCHSCATAAEARAPYEIEPYRPGEHWILVHSQSCEERSAERGECTPLEADLMVQPGG